MSTSADRARAERAAQGLETPAPADTAARAYRITAEVLESAAARITPIVGLTPAVSPSAPCSLTPSGPSAGGLTGGVGPAVSGLGSGKCLGPRNASSGDAPADVRRPTPPTTKQPRREATRRGRDSAAL